MISIATALVQCMILTGKGCRRFVPRSCDLMQSAVIKMLLLHGGNTRLAKFTGANSRFGRRPPHVTSKVQKFCGTAGVTFGATGTNGRLCARFLSAVVSH